MRKDSHTLVATNISVFIGIFYPISIGILIFTLIECRHIVLLFNSIYTYIIRTNLMVLVYTQYTYATFAYIFVYTPMYFNILFKPLVDINAVLFRSISFHRKRKKEERRRRRVMWCHPVLYRTVRSFRPVTTVAGFIA